jgi:hypothetical protein
MAGQGADGYVGPAGEQMAANLYADPELTAAVNEWCQRLGLGCRVRMLEPVSQDIILTCLRAVAGGRPRG